MRVATSAARGTIRNEIIRNLLGAGAGTRLARHHFPHGAGPATIRFLRPNRGRASMLRAATRTGGPPMRRLTLALVLLLTLASVACSIARAAGAGAATP